MAVYPERQLVLWLLAFGLGAAQGLLYELTVVLSILLGAFEPPERALARYARPLPLVWRPVPLFSAMSISLATVNSHSTAHGSFIGQEPPANNPQVFISPISTTILGRRFLCPAIGRCMAMAHLSTAAVATLSK